jgi:hypothetical protein
MTETACIYFPGGKLLLPARTPYEREVIVDHVRHRLRRDGFVRLERSGRASRIVAVADAMGERCRLCGASAGNAACRRGGRLLCVSCAVGDDPQSETAAAVRLTGAANASIVRSG